MKLSEFKGMVIEIHGRKMWEQIEESYAYEVYMGTEEMQLSAVIRDIYRIANINNPTEKMQLEAVKQNGYIIKYINNPTEKAQLEAIKQNPFAISCINNPTDKMIQEVLKRTKKGKIPNHMLGYLKNDLKEDKKEV